MSILSTVGLVLVLTLMARLALLFIFFEPLDKRSFVGAAKQSGGHTFVGSGFRWFKTVIYHPFIFVFLRGRNVTFGGIVYAVWRFDGRVLSPIMWLEVITGAFLIISR